jgi:site-specific DNA-cytosine methylase
LTSVFACERARAARKVLQADFPGLQLFGDACTDAIRMPPCDVLLVGFPCQPFSGANRHRRGSGDERCDVVWAIVGYVQRVRPRIVVLENVPGITAWGRDVLEYIVDEFQASGYRMDMQTLSSDVHGGVPQRRRRLYLIAVLSPAYALEWPAPLPMQALPALLTDNFQPPESRPTAPRAAAKVDAAERELCRLGFSLEERCQVVVNCHSELGKVFVEKTPCLTAARGAQGGFWLCGHHRMMSVVELLRLQGISPASTQIAAVLSARQAGALLGNAFTLTVVARVLVSALRCHGCRLVDPVPQLQALRTDVPRAA